MAQAKTTAAKKKAPAKGKVAPKKKTAAPKRRLSRKRVAVMNTAFRDGFQSAFGARVSTADFLPALEAACDAGMSHFEAGGGARFQSLFFYCNENAFDMMDAFRETAGPEANLQTLARGVNVVGLDSQSSDVIKLHAQMFKKHGMSTIRNFDALNDVNNLVYSGKCIAEAGLRHEVCVTMMALPPGCEGAHTPAFYMDTLGQILDAEIPFDSVCFKDASGTSAPAKVYETIRLARKRLPAKTHIRFHTHETAGNGVTCYRAALEAGVNGIDLSMAPCSGGTCQPDIAVMWHALSGTDYDLDVDIDKVMAAEKVFKDCMEDYFVPPEALAVDPMILRSPMPGGALTANSQMMRDNGILHKLPEVIEAMGEVVRRGGFGTSVTPVSQFYFQQAFNNVMFGPWVKVVESYGRMVLGYFGKTPVPPDPEIVKIASEQLGLDVTTQGPIEMNDADPKKGLDVARKLLDGSGIEATDESLFIAATCKDKGIAFLKGEAKTGLRKKDKTPEPPLEAEEVPGGAYTITIDGEEYAVKLEPGHAVVNGKRYDIGIQEGLKPAKAASSPEAAPVSKTEVSPTAKPGASTGGGEAVKAPMGGVVLRIPVRVGDSVKPGDPVAVLEAMKMEVEVKTATPGTVTAVAVSPGGQVGAGDTLVWIN